MTQESTSSSDALSATQIERPSIWPLFLLSGALVCVGFYIVLRQDGGQQSKEQRVEQPSDVLTMKALKLNPLLSVTTPKSGTFEFKPTKKKWKARYELSQEVVRQEGKMSSTFKTAIALNVSFEATQTPTQYQFRLSDVKLGMSKGQGEPIQSTIPAQLEKLLNRGAGTMSVDVHGNVTSFTWTMTTNSQMKPTLKLVQDALRVMHPVYASQQINQKETWVTRLPWSGSAQGDMTVKGGLVLKNEWVGTDGACEVVTQKISGSGDLKMPSLATPFLVKVGPKSEGLLCYDLEQKMAPKYDLELHLVTSGAEEGVGQTSMVKMKMRHTK